MIPIQLTLQGLYSYQAKQTIDFTRLTSAGLFGIFGMVGSGKSSILEAITFALYGRTDRLNLSGDNRNYNMMNLKSKELLIDFIFEAGSERTLYRSIVKGRRNSKRFEEVKTLDRTAYRRVDNEWIPIEQEALQDAIGLSYENFKRTIIIPQGQFQEFLQLGNKDRTQMLKELFNLEKFEFFYKVVSLESKNNEQKHQLEGQLQQLGNIDEGQIEKYQAELQELEQTITAQKKMLEEQLQNEEQQRYLQELVRKRGDAEKVVRELAQQEPAWRALEKRLARYELCHYRFKQRLELLEERGREKEKRSIHIEHDRNRLIAVETAIEEIGNLLARIKPAYDKRDELQKRAADLSRLLRMKTAAAVIEKEKQRLLSGSEILEKVTKRADDLKVEKQHLEEHIKTLRSSMPDLTLLSDIRSWYDEKRNLENQQGEVQKEINRYANQVEEVKREQSQLLTNGLFEKLPHDSGYAAMEDCLEQDAGRVKAAQLKLQVEEHHLLVKEQLKRYARELEEGHPCPLCGSTNHPEIYRSDDQGKQLQRIADEKNRLEQQLNHLASLSKQVTLLRSRQEQAGEHRDEWSGKGKKLQQKITDHMGRFHWDKYHEEEELNNAFLEVKKIEEATSRQEEALSQTTSQLEQEESNRERYRSALEQIRNGLTVQETTLTTLREQLEIIHPDEYREAGLEEIEKERQQLLQEQQQLVEEYEEKSDLLQKQTREKDALSSALQINNRELVQEQTAIESLQQQIDEELAKTSFKDLGEVRAILSEAMEPETEKMKLTAFNDQLLRSRSTYDQLQKEIGGRRYDAEAHGKLLGEINTLREKEKKITEQQIEMRLLLKQLMEDLQSMATLKEALEKVEARGENIRTMKSLFKASGFVNWISTVYLHNLCNAANDRFFRLTRQKLSLEITPDNNFQVRDFMNEGKVRSVKTLSGGQTFQASLSLALALADNIQQITCSSQNFFFLDEGFGSLDKESLDIVFDTLKTLRRENRIVGVISHVEEMQQEIEAHLRIENHPERGSLICRSWEE